MSGLGEGDLGVVDGGWGRTRDGRRWFQFEGVEGYEVEGAEIDELRTPTSNETQSSPQPKKIHLLLHQLRQSHYPHPPPPPLSP